MDVLWRGSLNFGTAVSKSLPLTRSTFKVSKDHKSPFQPTSSDTLYWMSLLTLPAFEKAYLSAVAECTKKRACAGHLCVLLLLLLVYFGGLTLPQHPFHTSCLISV